MTLRPGRDEDAADFIALIGAAWAEYPGVGLLVDEEVPELRALATYFAEAGGVLWVHDIDGGVCAMIGTKPLGDGAWELCKVYARPALRGTGVAAEMVAVAEAHARAEGGTEMRLWSDTNFDRAHRFYEKLGYIRHGGIRALQDASNTLEFGYMKPLAGLRVMALDVASAGSAVPALAAIRGDGATGRAYFAAVAKAVALRHSVLLVAWLDGTLAGAAEIGLDGPANRAVLRTLMVREGLRRRGVARQLMAAGETAARAAGRDLMVTETRTGAAVLAALGWVEAGRYPDGIIGMFKVLG